MNSPLFEKAIGDGLEGISSKEVCLDAALIRLGAYIDEEAGSLEDLMRLTGNEIAVDDIRALHDLHLAAGALPSDIRQLLKHAQLSLERLLGLLQGIPVEASWVEKVPSDFSAWQRWSGARLQDLTTTVSRTLADLRAGRRPSLRPARTAAMRRW